MEPNEKHLVESCLRQDRRAQRQLYEKYKTPMFRLCLRYARDRQEAEDLLQEGFIKVFCDLSQYRGEGALGGWIRKVMINVALQHLRKQKKLFETIEVEKIAETEEAEEMILSDLRAKSLTKIIQQLPPGYRTVFNLYVIEGYSHKEIADSLDIQINTSKSQLSKAKAMLRRLLEESIVGR